MKVKSFFAASVEEALNQARKEFGSEAVLLQSRKSLADSREFGEYEVVCALLEEDAPAHASAHSEKESVGNNNAVAPIDKLFAELAEVKRSIQRLQKSVVRSGPSTAGMPSEIQDVLTALLEAEVDTELAERIISEAGPTVQGASSARSDARFSTLVHRYITRIANARANLFENDRGTRVIALVGPPGAGKTSCIAKIAARYGVARHKTTHVISLDDYRIGGSEQLRAYATVLGVSFEAVTNDLPLARAFGEHHWKDLVLIDVPGFSASEMDCAADAAKRLGDERIETHLVVPASLRGADLRRIVDAYALFDPASLIFSRIDETSIYGPILNEIVRTGKPASFLSNGPAIPDDLQPATKSGIADLVLGMNPGKTKRISAAA